MEAVEFVEIENKLSILLPERILGQIQDMLLEAYNKGEVDGYARAHEGGSTIINILAGRIGGRVEISRETLDTPLKEIEQGHTEDGGVYFIVKD